MSCTGPVLSDHGESMSHASVASDALAFAQIPIEWDTDPDDLDYEPSSCTASVLDESSEHPDDMSIDLDPDLDLSRAPSPHATRSRKASSSSVALSVSVALDPLRVPLPTGIQELAMLHFQLRMTHDLLARELERIRAEGAAVHACQWCSTAAMSQSALAAGARAEGGGGGGGEREKRKRKRRRSGRETTGGARHVTHSAFCERWIAEQRAQTELERDAASRAHQKRQMGQPGWQRIREAIASRVFAEPLASYKRKEDLVVLSGALGLRMTGTKAELRARIESFVSAHSDSDIQQNPRFSGLFHNPTEDAHLDGAVITVSTNTLNL
ncbi:hypothetical protein BC826DRAFT_113607 [Russula brevipes]|nr:hypothetical protein BC826DRAFT_113607 [Russula brevipes]